MTGPDRSDDDLAPVTDLFGARSRREHPSAHDRQRSAAETQDQSDVWSDPGSDPSDAEPSPVSTVAGVGAPVTRLRAAGRGEPARRADAPTARSADGQDADGQGADGQGADGQGADDQDAADQGTDASWLPPVTGSGRAEPAGYGETADADRASVFSIVSGEQVDPADVARPVAEQAADAERISMRALGRRGVSISELRKTLTGNDLDDGVVELEIERLLGVGLLDDAALASDLVERLHRRKGLGRQGVVTELRRRGIEQSVIDAALEVAEDDGDDEAARAQELATKRAGALRGLDRDTAERRLTGFLMRRGYGSAIVRTAVRRALDGTAPRGSVRFE